MGFQKVIDKIESNSYVLGFLFTFITSLILFYPSLNYYFFQDDWFVLNWVGTGDLKSFLLPYADTIYWRPLSMPIFFWSGYKLFGLNPLWYHIVVFVFFGALIVSVYKLFRLLFNRQELALFGAFLYATWPVHFMSLSWLVATQYILMPLFQTISFIFFIKFFKTKNKNLWFASFTFFIFGIFSHEFTLVLPIILFCWGFLIKRKNLFVYILPFLLVDLLFLFFRFVIYPIRAEGSYQMHLNHLVLDNLFWYVAWAFNFPESFKDLIDQRFPTKSIKLLLGSWQIFLPIIMMLLIDLNFLRKSIKKNFKSIVFGFLWIFIGLLPIITLVDHSYTVYLSFAGIGFLYIVLNLFKKSRAYFMYVFGVLWLISSIFNLKFTRNTHWIVNEQAISRAYTTFASHKLSDPESGSVILVWEADSSLQQKYGFISSGELNVVRQSLFDQDAMQVVFNNKTIKTYYFLEDIRTGRERFHLVNLKD